MGAAAAAAPLAQQFVLSSQDRAKLISVDFAVIGADGLPVTDLRTGDVTVRIDGRTRPIRALEYVPLTAMTAGVAPPYGSNLVSDDGRAIVLLVDLETIRAGREATLREHVAQLARTLSPADRLELHRAVRGQGGLDDRSPAGGADVVHSERPGAAE